MIPFPLYDTDTWMTTVVRNGVTAHWRGRMLNEVQFLGVAGITFISSQRIKQPNTNAPMTCSLRHLEAAKSCIGRAADAQSTPSLRKYTVVQSTTTKISTFVGDALTQKEPGLAIIERGGKLVASLTHVVKITGEDVIAPKPKPLTPAQEIEHLKAVAADLEAKLTHERQERSKASEAYGQRIEGLQAQLNRATRVISRIDDIAYDASFGNRGSSLLRIEDIATEFLRD